jgi:hypothetical protein
MMTERQRRVVFLLASAGFAAAAPLVAAVWRSPGAVNPAGVPFELAQVPAAPCSDSPVEGDGLSIQYVLHNRSAETLTQVGIEVVSFSAGGQLKGFRTYTGAVEIGPGERTTNTYAAAGFPVAPGDRLVMLPYSARGSTLRWQVPDAEFLRRTQALTAAQGDTPPALRSSCLNPALCKTCRCGVASSFCESDASGAPVVVRCDCGPCPATAGQP